MNFIRTTHTWISYLSLGYFGYFQTIWGPMMPLLREELGLNFTIGGLHATFFAVGMVAAGIISVGLTQFMSEKTLFWFGSAGMASGVGLLIIANTVYMTLSAALLMGLFGTLLLIMLQASLAAEHHQFSAKAILEANVSAAIGASLAPLTVGFFVGLAIDWRAALIVGICFWILIFIFGYRRAFPTIPTASEESPRSRLPSAFWLVWFVIVLGVAAEWCVTLWTADFLIQALNFDLSVASLSVAVFAISGILARLLGARLTERFSAPQMLLVTLSLAFLGTSIFWISRHAMTSFIALALIGLGIANLYPLGVAIALQLAPEQRNLASARASLGAAIAILIAPQTLGIAADGITIQNAYAIIPVLVMVAIGLIITLKRVTLSTEKLNL